MKTQNIDISQETIVHFCQHWYIIKLSLFDSVLRNDFRLGSDIDVLVEFRPEHIPGFLKLHRMQEELSTLLGNQPIDLVTPKLLNHRILSEAAVYCNSDG